MIATLTIFAASREYLHQSCQLIFLLVHFPMHCHTLYCPIKQTVPFFYLVSLKALLFRNPIMEGIAFSDGSRTVYLAAGYYVVSRGARVIRVISPKPKEHEDANTPLSRFQDYEQQVSLYEGDGIEYQDQQVTGLIGGTSATPGRDSYSESSHEETVEGRGHASATLQDTVHQVSLSPVGGYLTPAPGSYDEDTSMMNDGAIQGYTTVIEIGSPLYTESRTGTDRQGSYMSQGLLSFDRFAQMGATSYDPQWIYNNGVDPNVLNGFTSRIKIEEMFGKGVFEIGDIFRLVDQSGRIFLDREAVVSLLCVAEIHLG